MHASDSETQKEMKARWLGCFPKGVPNLIHSAMGVMRRGLPYTVEGDYSKAYQAQSILTALMAGDSERYDRWVQKHGTNIEEPVSDAASEHGWFWCPGCNHVI